MMSQIGAWVTPWLELGPLLGLGYYAYCGLQWLLN